jgi:CRP/FNR family transcriptional regulator, transcriptional activator FtrB
MRPSDRQDIRDLDLFSGMDEDNFERLMRGAYVQNFPPQVQLITQGDPSDFLHIVIEGRVELFAGWNDRETTMMVARPVSTFIVAATIQDAPLLMSARTMERSRVVLLPSIDVREVFAVDHVFARAVVSELAQCYRGVLKDAKDLKLRSSVERLANYLLKKQKLAGGGVRFDLDMEKRRLASRLGMTPENLSRAIKALQPHGVAVDGKTVEIADSNDLQRFAKPTRLIDDPKC